MSGAVKLRDIPILNLEDLQGLSSPTHLQVFFEMVALCSAEDTIRIHVAKSHVNQELANLIHIQQILEDVITGKN